MKEDKDIWVFLSHSNKDYEKVREVRNLLEEQNFRPLMFFLNCLNEDEEIDSLIKREIDSRKRFILCDSENAKSSKWVQREVDYIKSKQRYYYTLDLNSSSDKIAKDILQFARESTVYISYSRNDEVYFEQLKSMLYEDLGLRVFDMKNDLGDGLFEKQIDSILDTCFLNGYIIFLITSNFLKSPYCLYELKRVFLKSQDKNIIFLREASAERPSIDNYNVTNEFVCEFKENKLQINEGRFYWGFFQNRISEGVKKGDPASFYWLAYHFYWDDDRFDNPSMENMRLFTLKNAKYSMDKGYILAEDLYDRIIKDYPELKDKI